MAEWPLGDTQHPGALGFLHLGTQRPTLTVLFGFEKQILKNFVFLIRQKGLLFRPY